MQLSANAQRLVYGTYFGTGTTHVDGGTSRFDKQGLIYQAICVRSQPSGSRAPAIITTPNAFARTQIGAAQTTSAAFKMDILRLNADFVPAANGQAGATAGCAPLTVNFSRLTPSNSGTTWNFGNGQTSTQANNVSTVYPTPGTYTVRLTAYDSTSCQPSVSTTSTITVVGLPRPQVGPDQTVCPGSSVTLTVSNASPAQNAIYSWSPATGLNTTSGPTVVATPAATTRYIITATTIGGSCTSTDTVVVSVSPQLPVSVAPPAAICAGSSATLTAADAGPGATYTWSPATGLSSTTGRTVTATPTANTTYTVNVSRNGCAGSATVSVRVKGGISIIRIYAQPPMATVGQLVAFVDTIPGTPLPITNRRWEFGDGQTATGLNPSHSYAAPGTYLVRLNADYDGCPFTATTSVTVAPARQFEQPNIITPNADGLNDDFRPYVTAELVKVEIYNRWGRQVFAQANYTGGWGTAPGVVVGLYYYRLSTASGQSWTGWLEVVK